MAKKKKASRKKVVKNSPQHSLPAGFWRQVTAVALIAISVLLVVAWFGAGGPILEWIQTNAMALIGYTVYVIPFLFIYVAVEIFRAEQNKLPFVMKFATALLIVWFSGLFGLNQLEDKTTAGGWLGDLINSAMFMVVNGVVAGFIYVLLIIVTILFVVRVSPIVIIQKLWQLAQTEQFDNDDNVKVMRKAAAAEKFSKSF